MQKKCVELKSGSFTFLVLYLYDNNIDIINEYLYKKIQTHPNFFKKAPVVINISSLLNIVNWKKIKEIILSHGFFIVGVTGCRDTFCKKIIFDSGLPVLSNNKNYYIKHGNCHNITNDSKYIHNIKKTKKRHKTHVIESPVRSGQKIYAKNADLIVTNTVNAGAELVADGNIHIYGLFRGRVLAGANGDTNSKIFCTQLFAELVSISGEYWLSEQIPANFFGKSVQIYLKNQFLTIHSLS